MIMNAYVNPISLDPYNKQRTRNIHNTPHREFNCGGYALNTMSWYVPLRGFGYAYKNQLENKLKIAALVEAMCLEFDDLREIHDVKELQKDEYAIALRITPASEYVHDFHFMRRGDNGVWYQKQGNTHGIKAVPKDVVFSACWYADEMTSYMGEIALLAKKK